MITMPRDDRWPEYWQRFPEAAAEFLRPGCQPRRLLHAEPPDQAVVLIHGLSDSPWFMLGLAEFFYCRLGYDVYLPLLQKHGLKEPAEMQGVSLAAWLENVEFAITEAAARTGRVSVGGLSAGGALALHAAATNSQANGELYLFSAALRLIDKGIFWPGWLREALLLTPLIALKWYDEPLVSANPYRYSMVHYDAARELVKLIRVNEGLLGDYGATGLVDRRLFLAWTESEQVVSLSALQNLVSKVAQGLVTTFVLDETLAVDHASVVLREPVLGQDGTVLEKANPQWQEMLDALARFAVGTVTLSDCTSDRSPPPSPV